MLGGMARRAAVGSLPHRVAPEGRMWATWFQGSYEEFIKGNDEGWKRGVRILHFLGGSVIDVAGPAQSRRPK